MPVIPVDKAESLASLKRSQRRFGELLRSIADPGATAIGRWTSADTAAHVAETFALEVGVLEGEGTPVQTIDAIADFNEEGLKRYRERNPKSIADRLDSVTTELVTALERWSWDEMVEWHGGIKVPVWMVPSILIGECLVHGFDIAKADGKSWSIPRDEAVVALAGASELVPYYVDEQATSDLDACFEIRLRGGPTMYLIFDRGRGRVEADTDRRIDVRMTVDPATYLLVGYKRISQWGPALKGQMLVWGRKPWLSLRLATAFKSA
jgi:uncharacterized protein (TIGR03083 family)